MREAKRLKNKEEQQDNESETALQRQQVDSEESLTVVPTPEASEVYTADSEEHTHHLQKCLHQHLQKFLKGLKRET